MLKQLLNSSVWAVVALTIGWQLGYNSGYGRGVRQIANLIIEFSQSKDEPDFAIVQRDKNI